MNRQQILSVINTMAKHDDFYARLMDNLSDLQVVDNGAYEELMQMYEKMHFIDIRELRKYFEKSENNT